MLYIGPVGQALDSSGVCKEVGDKGDTEDNDTEDNDNELGFEETSSVLALEYCDGIPRPERTFELWFSSVLALEYCDGIPRPERTLWFS